MIKLIRIKVECHSGYKSDEYPTSFKWNNGKYEIHEIKDRWYQCVTTPDWPVSNYFKVVVTTGEEYIIKHDLENDEWFLWFGSIL